MLFYVVASLGIFIAAIVSSYALWKLQEAELENRTLRESNADLYETTKEQDGKLQSERSQRECLAIRVGELEKANERLMLRMTRIRTALYAEGAE